jgi:hypothetical protein
LLRLCISLALDRDIKGWGRLLQAPATVSSERGRLTGQKAEMKRMLSEAVQQHKISSATESASPAPVLNLDYKFRRAHSF